MAKKAIFVGSAAETKELAASVARALADKGYRPLRWWLEFPAGSITLDRLLEIAKEEADGAVFLFTSVDKTWYRGESLSSPRDNVVLEYGMFVANLGRKRTLILKDEGARLPSDITAITFVKIIDDVATVAERTVRHFDEQFGDPTPPLLEAIAIIADPTVVEDQIGSTLPMDWCNRNLYFGVEGAKAWLETVNEPAYSPKNQELKLRRLLLKALEQVDARSFVSLGPGDAVRDVEIAIKLRQKEPWLQYIPVDISDGLLVRAIKCLSDQVRVPAGILADFEDRLNFIQRQLRIHATSPILFTLLGNTLGDLDNYEGSFLSSLGNMMQTGDFFLLEVSLAGPKWNRKGDRRGKHSSYGPAYRRFIANGLSRRTAESVESIVANFRSRFRFNDGESDVENTKCIDVVDTESQRLACTIRRYDWESLLAWIDSVKQFNILFKDNAFIDELLGDGVILMIRR